uniref:uncharacterized protein LOC114672694 n=1 Tax=Macaca mulatta TaxID=9544 RepID=UPI0010A2A55E|nr:uncharacterized protein LOC114672694 [Macaca mulatta]
MEEQAPGASPRPVAWMEAVSTRHIWVETPRGRICRIWGHLTPDASRALRRCGQAWALTVSQVTSISAPPARLWTLACRRPLTTPTGACKMQTQLYPPTASTTQVKLPSAQGQELTGRGPATSATSWSTTHLHPSLSPHSPAPRGPTPAGLAPGGGWAVAGSTGPLTHAVPTSGTRFLTTPVTSPHSLGKVDARHSPTPTCVALCGALAAL